MTTMNISLSDELDEFVRGKTASGQYASSSEVVRAALRLLEREDALHHEKMKILKREVGIGLKQARERKFSKRSVSEIADAVRARHVALAE
jgi:antitoxin ParD1/3/4